MKQLFTEPEVKVLHMENQDIVCSSTTCSLATNETSYDPF